MRASLSTGNSQSAIFSIFNLCFLFVNKVEYSLWFHVPGQSDVTSKIYRICSWLFKSMSLSISITLCETHYVADVEELSLVLRQAKLCSVNESMFTTFKYKCSGKILNTFFFPGKSCFSFDSCFLPKEPIWTDNTHKSTLNSSVISCCSTRRWTSLNLNSCLA